jgi:hypothetical protein
MRINEILEGWGGSPGAPDDRQRPERDPDAAYDDARQAKLDAEAEAEWAKKPKKITYKLIGRGPNMEPNYEFDGKEYNSQEEAIAARKQLMANPKTPHPEHIGIHTITRLVKSENESVVDEEPASRALCTSGKPDSALGASQLSSCKSQGYRSRDGGKSHKIGSERVKVRGQKIKGKKYGGPLPDWS